MKRYIQKQARRRKRIDQDIIAILALFLKDLAILWNKRNYRCYACRKLAITQPAPVKVIMTASGMVKQVMGWYCKPCRKRLRKPKVEILGMRGS